MSYPRLTEKAQRQMKNKWALEQEAVELLSLVAAEFETDPTSVQCFDLRTVERVREVTKQLKSLAHVL